ncbi:ASTRA complex subunit [Pichia californica]|uniref:ASTRA-associated protein 1 n=1 Tax=Pichia californica TaxID=460514 RepID=A0A9P6WH83_9ASCO|nr:ASTRA complex subunit [[Candida] californica]KAG0687144.1 ASTRA complex subunit [[Candida] californica]
MIEKSLVTTLRLHSSPITCLEPFYLPSTISYNLQQNDDDDDDNGDDKKRSEHLLFNPSLITADESGLIIWWNLSTRRPLGIWKPHNESILSVQQLGINWDTDGKHNFNLSRLSNSYGQLLTHSKDGTIKIWNLINFINKENFNEGYTYSCLLKKKLINTNEDNYLSPPLLFEMPVNTLNFSNVQANSIFQLVTPATTDSEGWDLYKIDLTQSEEYLKLKRLLQNQKVGLEKSSLKIQEVNNNFDDDDDDDDNDNDDVNTTDFTKRGRTGVIMKFAWIDSNRFIVGYENGHIIGFHIYQEDSKYHVKQFLIEKSLDGNPITSIVIDKVNDKILCSSTGSKICVIELSNQEHKSKIFETKRKGIHDISCDPYSNSIGIITWDGYTRIYEYDDENIFKFNFKMRRQLPAISNSKEVIDNQNAEISQVNNLQTQRSSVLKFTEKQLDPRLNKDTTVNILYNNGRSKNIVRRNREEIYGERWLFVGYQDGKVSMYSIS